LRLHKATGEPQYLRQAEELVSTMDRLFWDNEGAGYFMTDRAEQLIAQSKHPYDGAIASGNSEAANVLADLAAVTGRNAYQRQLRQTLTAFAGGMARNARGLSRMVLAVHHHLNGYAGTAAQTAAVVVPADARFPDSRDHVWASGFVSVQHLVPGTSFAVAARLVVDAGWHINANPASHDFLIPTTLQVTSDLPAKVRATEYPPATVFRPAFVEDSLEVYADTIVLRARVDFPANADPVAIDRLSLQLTFQACDDTRCLAPAEISLPVQAAAADAEIFPQGWR
jgi:uncharacterized protein